MFIQQLEKICKEKNIKPTVLLKKLKISTSKYTNWKNGSKPNIETAYLIAQELNVSLDYLTSGKEDYEKYDDVLKYYKKLNERNKIKVEMYAEEKLKEQENESD